MITTDTVRRSRVQNHCLSTLAVHRDPPGVLGWNADSDSDSLEWGCNKLPDYTQEELGPIGCQQELLTWAEGPREDSMRV